MKKNSPLAAVAVTAPETFTKSPSAADAKHDTPSCRRSRNPTGLWISVIGRGTKSGKLGCGVGDQDGSGDGLSDGQEDGSAVGTRLGDRVGTRDGGVEGPPVGANEGGTLGSDVGRELGRLLGRMLGPSDG